MNEALRKAAKEAAGLLEAMKITEKFDEVQERIVDSALVGLYAALESEENAQDKGRKLVVPSANYWFQAARDPQYSMAERLLFMENAVNHLEGWLINERKLQGKPIQCSEGELK